MKEPIMESVEYRTEGEERALIREMLTGESSPETKAARKKKSHLLSGVESGMLSDEVKRDLSKEGYKEAPGGVGIWKKITENPDGENKEAEPEDRFMDLEKLMRARLTGNKALAVLEAKKERDRDDWGTYDGVTVEDYYLERAKNGLKTEGYVEGKDGIWRKEGVSRFGENVTIKNYWIRHAQKMSGEIVNAEKTSISSSAISESGQKKAFTYGKGIEASGHGAKGYVSTSERTSQTLDKIVEGYQAHNFLEPVRKLRVREELTSNMPEAFVTLYGTKFDEEKKKLLAELNIKSDEFKNLPPDEQESIAEKAEEPVIREWLDNPESELAKLYPPKEAAGSFAAIFDKRHERMAGKLYSGSEIDLFHVTHKTITEPFLVSGVLIDSDGNHVTTLEQLGGSLGTLDNWESEVKNDEQGNGQVIVKIRGKEYGIDNEVFESLVHQGNEEEDRQKSLANIRESLNKQ